MARRTIAELTYGIDASDKPRKITHNTIQYTRASDGAIVIRLHDTDIIATHKDGSITLDSGGWQTVTTKERLNRFLPLRLGSEQGVWVLSWCGQEYAFADGITLHPNGQVTGAGIDPKATLKLRKRVKAYAKAYVKALRVGDVPKPSGGDCWGCFMRAKDGRQGTLGRRDHILSHFDESYFVPSILQHAMKRFGASPALQHNVACIWQGETDKLFADFDFIWKQVEKLITRWCYQELGLAV